MEDKKEKEGYPQVMGQGTQHEAGERTNKNEVWTPHNETHHCVHQFNRNTVTLSFLLCIGFPNCCLLVQAEVMPFCKLAFSVSALEDRRFHLAGSSSLRGGGLDHMFVLYIGHSHTSNQRHVQVCTLLLRGKRLPFCLLFLCVFPAALKNTCNWRHLHSFGFTICGH